MGLFSNILEKLGLKKKDDDASVKKPVVTAAPVATNPKTTGNVRPVTSPNAVPTPAMVKPVVAISEVDVVKKLDSLAKANPQKLDWKVSIVDLLKLLELDSSLTARKELATELGCPPEKMGGDYAEMNVWLHKTVLQKIAANGGNIPKELL